MSKPFLPGQNSKHWGYDLNNYLLSLDSRMSAIENKTAADNTIIQVSGVGFNGTDYSFVDTNTYRKWLISTTFPVNKNMTLSGSISYQSYSADGLQIKTHHFSESEPYIIFNSYINNEGTENASIYYTAYNEDGTIPAPYSEFLNTNYIFYAVYLYFDDYSETKGVKTVVSPDYIFRGDMIMIGILERDATNITTYTFIPRIYSSGKTLYETSRDTYQSTASIQEFKYDNTNDTEGEGPFVADKFKFFFMTNGINAINAGSSLKPEGGFIVQSSLDIISKETTSQRKLVNLEKEGNILEDMPENLIVTGGTYSYYLAPSGNIYIQWSAEEKTPSSTGDYSLELNNPISKHKYFRCGALVYLGSAYIYNDTIIWSEAKQNGISPVVLGSSNNNHYKVWIEDQQFWFDGDKYFQVNCTDYLNTNSFAMTFKYKKSPTANLITSNIELNESSLLLTSKDRIYASSLTSSQHSFSHDGVLGLALGSTSTDNYIMYRSLIDDNMSNWFSIRDNGLFSDNTYKLRIESYNSIYNKRHLWDFHSNDGTFETTKLKVVSEANLCEGLKVVEGIYSETIESTKYNFSTEQSNSFLLLHEPISNNENYKATIESSSGKGSFYIIDTQGELSPIEVVTTSSVTIYYKYNSSDRYFYLYDQNKNPYYNASLTFYYYHKIETPSQTTVSNILIAEGATTLSDTLTVEGATTLSDTLTVEGTTTLQSDLEVNTNITVKGNINVGGATNYTSDARLKNNIALINQNKCYEAVQNLDVSTYTYKTTNQDSLGLIAQDIERILPEYAHILVHEDDNGYKSVFEHKLLFILWEALKKEIKERKKLGGK